MPRITLAGIRNQHPELDENGRRRMLEGRIALGERLKSFRERCGEHRCQVVDALNASGIGCFRPTNP